MKLKAVYSLLVLAVIFSMASCASGPKTDKSKSVSSIKIPETLTVARKAADDSRAKALELKANVAVKALFDEAETGYTTASALADKNDYTPATTGFTDSATLFQKAVVEAEAKRTAALESLKKAEADRKASEQALLDAENAQKGDSL